LAENSVPTPLRIPPQKSVHRFICEDLFRSRLVTCCRITWNTAGLTATSSTTFCPHSVTCPGHVQPNVVRNGK